MADQAQIARDAHPEDKRTAEPKGQQSQNSAGLVHRLITKFKGHAPFQSVLPFQGVPRHEALNLELPEGVGLTVIQIPSNGSNPAEWPVTEQGGPTLGLESWS